MPIKHINNVVSAKLPSKDEDPALHQLVYNLIRHRETHLDSSYSCCNKKGRCIYNFPQPIRLETTVDEYGRVQYRRRSKDDA
jgi:hypothetical protein